MKQDDCQEKVVGRLFICADLHLLTPLLIGQGNAFDEGGVDIKVQSVTLDKTSATLVVGETKKLTPTVSPADATNKDVT